jgi:hypothetical protein
MGHLQGVFIDERRRRCPTIRGRRGRTMSMPYRKKKRRFSGCWEGFGPINSRESDQKISPKKVCDPLFFLGSTGRI